MEKIIDIYAQYADFGEKLSKKNSWYGRILLGENNYFEGIVQDTHRINLDLVFGKFTDKGIELTRCAKNDEEVPYFYEAGIVGSLYQGDLSAVNLYEQIRLGECQIILIPADKTREEYEDEKNGIRVAATHIKHHLGEIGTELHEDFEVERIRNNAKVACVSKAYY